MENRNCLHCNKVIRGRIDKKFCDDVCRNNYNNQINSDATNFVRKINNTLRKNRRILQDILGDKETAKTTKDKLSTEGFSFTYFTHIYSSKQGNVYHFCYDFGYMALGQDWYLVVQRKEN